KNKILKKTRHRKISLVRQIAIYLTRQVCRLPLAKVGEMFGVSDHTSVLYAIRKIEKLKKENPQLGEEIEFLKTKLLEG
ncbi:MAG TPA: chromosomal replication initiator protein DnaA, partial [Aquifex aeolicus]|nr:chromosomal replication initiator protein DnaA [Aquifex aeolicus]